MFIKCQEESLLSACLLLTISYKYQTLCLINKFRKGSQNNHMNLLCHKAFSYIDMEF